MSSPVACVYSHSLLTLLCSWCLHRHVTQTIRPSLKASCKSLFVLGKSSRVLSHQFMSAGSISKPTLATVAFCQRSSQALRRGSTRVLHQEIHSAAAEKPSTGLRRRPWPIRKWFIHVDSCTLSHTHTAALKQVESRFHLQDSAVLSAVSGLYKTITMNLICNMIIAVHVSLFNPPKICLLFSFKHCHTQIKLKTESESPTLYCKVDKMKVVCHDPH